MAKLQGRDNVFVLGVTVHECTVPVLRSDWLRERGSGLPRLSVTPDSPVEP